MWFEIILMQMLLRYAYDRDPCSPHIQYALTEVGDECRHSIMFARMTERYGVPDYAPRRVLHELARLYKSIWTGPTMFVTALVAEEITDQIGRESMRDETVQPLSRMIHKIHVTEDARHVRYAREELARVMPTTTGAGRSRARWVSALVAHLIATSLIHPEVYRSVGLDPAHAHKVARANPHHQDTIRWSARKLVPFLRGQGIIAGPAELLWRKAYLV